MNTYDWGVLISCRRVGEWPDWVTLHFKSLPSQCPSAELSEAMLPLRVFLDTTNFAVATTGQPADRLRHRPRAPSHAGAAARAHDFSSDWCKAEVDCIAEREDSCKYVVDLARLAGVTVALILRRVAVSVAPA